MNGCGGEGGFNFKILKEKINKLPFIKKEKVNSLYNRIELECCNSHDEMFSKGGNILDYIKANYAFVKALFNLLKWTGIIARLNICLYVFLALNIWGYKYFNFK